ncbi:MAG: hypothetical protein IKO10_03525 [Lachnospiraceae bacterium]|nr:hypothetical protein [Lachnospiraceae bacterium]
MEKKGSAVLQYIELSKGYIETSVIFVPTYDQYRMLTELSRSQFEQYLTDKGLSLYTDPAVLKNMLFENALQEVKKDPCYPESLQTWARKVLDKAEKIKAALEKNGYEDISVSVKEDYRIKISPMANGIEPPKKLEDVDYFLTHDYLVGGNSCLYLLAADIVNYDTLQKEQDRSEEDLQAFYEEKISTFIHDPAETWTTEQRDAYDYFSDYHKDVYGHRPYNGNNECQKKMNKKVQEEEKEM